MTHPTQFKPGNTANLAGRPKGIKDRRLELRALFDAEAEELINTAIKIAKEGETRVLVACLDRLTPRAKISAEDYISKPLPNLPVSTADEIQKMIECLMSQAEIGERPLSEAETLVNMYKNMLDTKLKVDQHGEIKDWMNKVESKLGISNDGTTQS